MTDKLRYVFMEVEPFEKPTKTASPLRKNSCII